MGLGSAVCEKCQVLAEYSDKGVYNPNTWHSGKISYWFCPICGNPDPKDNAGFDSARFKQLEENFENLTRLIKFAKGESP